MNTTNKKRNIPLSILKAENWQSLITKAIHGPDSGILLIILILTADDDGRGKIIAANIKSEFFTSEKWNENSIKEMLENIHKLNDNITFYHQNKNIFYQVDNWKKMQTIKLDRYKKSIYPALTKNNRICHKTNLFDKQTEPEQAQITELKPEQIGSKPYNKDNPAFIKGPNGQRLRLC